MLDLAKSPIDKLVVVRGRSVGNGVKDKGLQNNLIVGGNCKDDLSDQSELEVMR